MPRLSSIGFDVLYIITEERHISGLEEDLLLQKFRSSLKGKVSVFNTIDALERLAPNLKEKDSQCEALKKLINSKGLLQKSVESRLSTALFVSEDFKLEKTITR